VEGGSTEMTENFLPHHRVVYGIAVACEGSLYSLAGGACCVSPEYGGQTSSEKKGRIDFFIEHRAPAG
jgi:hypothetical protein